MNALTRMPSQQGNWVFDGTQWICSPCDGTGTPGQPPFCPPPGFPPAGCPPWFSGMNSPPWYPGANAGISFGNTAPQNPVRGHMWWNGAILALFDGAAWVNTATGVIVPPSGGGGGGSTGGVGTVVISTSPPGNPVAGMQWWNGSVLQVFDGTQWNIVGPGGAAGPVPTTTKVFSITNSTNSSLTAPFSVVQFANPPSLDTVVGWNSTTKEYRPTRAGQYYFQITAWLNADVATYFGVILAKNDQGAVSANTEIVAIYDLYSAVSGNAGYSSASGISLMNGTTDYVRMFAGSSSGVMSAQSYPTFQAWLLP